MAKFEIHVSIVTSSYGMPIGVFCSTLQGVLTQRSHPGTVSTDETCKECELLLIELARSSIGNG